ncbi:ATP-binding cassette domain-containing protein [Tessaracoccus sp. OS52]|uniref:ABC transporter ATP-binding protein/permease n=1 Tax=Tessaracoccus sp. OS52 TaxID=2886691 RepID=UPI001D1105E3|nr:ATP-binding cassette domain-containing protein [Tessaracoccus sp. OS52]
MSTDTAVRVRGLQRSYKDLHVLRGVDFDVARGSIFALLGSNGAGKTTVVKILSTLLAADAGAASVNGFDVATQAGEVRQSISLTGQFAAVDDVLTGRENLVLVARLRHLENPGAIADDLLQRFGLADAAPRPVSTYSGGMRRRLDIAMSLIGDPPVIFLDEPTTGLDPQGRLDVWRAVRELAAGGTTVLLTTQYWLAVVGILGLFTLALTWLAVIAGLSAKTVDGASAFSYPLIFLPFISSAFVPTETMPGPVRWFAEHQPVTSIANTIRDLLTQQPIGGEIWIALAWCAGILVVTYFAAMRIYRRKLGQTGRAD